MNQDIPEEHLSIIFYHGAYPLWSYLQEVVGINITEVCAYVAKEEPVLQKEDTKLVCRVVDIPYEGSVPSIYNNDKIFLLNSINTVFELLKAGIEKDGEKLLSAFKFKLDSQHNLILVGVESNEPVANRGIAIQQLD